MSTRAPHSRPAKAGSAVLGFLFITGLAVGFLGSALVLGTEPRMLFERSGPGSFQVTGSNHFAGYQFFTKTIDGVTKVRVDDSVRDDRRDSNRENRKQRRDKHVELTGDNGARLGWDREEDERQIYDFMRGSEPRLGLTDPPPWWRMGIAWFLVGFGILTFIGGVRNSFFPKTSALSPPA